MIFRSMFAIICKRKSKILRKDPLFIAIRNVEFVRPFSSSHVHTDDPEQQPFTVSYLINSCGLSPKDAVSTSKKFCIKSPENSDAVLHLLRKYGFTNVHIPKLVYRWPQVLVACPDKTLLPKLNFFCSFGVPAATLAQKISVYPLILQRSLKNHLIPSYNYLKNLLESDKMVVNVFTRAPRAFADGWQKEISSNVAILKERGISESMIVKLAVIQPSLLVFGKNKLGVCADRAAAMGFDKSKIVFVHAVQVFAYMTEPTLCHKKDVYRKWGWSESDINGAFLRHPLCMTLSEEKIMANMDFLVNEVGCKPSDVASCPVLLGLNLDRRMRPRWLVAEILKSKGFLKNSIGVNALFKLSEEKFLKKYIFDNQENIPQLLDFYRGKLSKDDLFTRVS